MCNLQSLLAFHRHEDSPALDIALPVSYLLDREYLQAVMDRLKTCDRRWERSRATVDLGPQLPDSHGLYMFVWSPPWRMQLDDQALEETRVDWFLYVGKAEDTTFKSRYCEYRKYLDGNPDLIWTGPEKNRAQRMSRWLQLDPLYYWFMVVDNIAEIDRLETKLINILNPPLNSEKSPRLVRGTSKPAFEKKTEEPSLSAGSAFDRETSETPASETKASAFTRR